MKTEQYNIKIINTITNLMLMFLPLSMFANYLNGRESFVILYFFIFLATLKHYFCFKSEQDTNKASEQILVILFGLFFAFFLIGEQKTFDILWILVIPFVAVMTSSLQRIKIWLFRTVILVIVMIGAAFFFPQYVAYEMYSLLSLLWALIFVSYLAYSYKTIQVKLEQKILSYQHSLENKISDAVKEIETLNHNINETQIEILERLGTLGEYRSKETGAHVKRVGLYTKELALLAGVDEEKATLFKRAAPLHDIGKAGIEDAILNKPARLTAGEYEIMKLHASIGEEILSGSDKPLIQIAAEIAGGHHEKFDGTGYPRALKGEAIPLSARVVAIADVFDALYSSRVYKKAWSIEEIIKHFETEKAKHFDPQITSLFLKNIEKFIIIYNENDNKHNIPTK
jgi:HD-GYP domain-containing protein (c-di-GMP phosphodiesterase class II)